MILRATLSWLARILRLRVTATQPRAELAGDLPRARRDPSDATGADARKRGDAAGQRGRLATLVEVATEIGAEAAVGASNRSGSPVVEVSREGGVESAWRAWSKRRRPGVAG